MTVRNVLRWWRRAQGFHRSIPPSTCTRTDHLQEIIHTVWRWTRTGVARAGIRDADAKNIVELSTALKQLAEKARAHKLALEDMQGGTFTITNLGGYGGTYFSPIVNWPEVAILGISRASIQPVFVDGAFQPRLLLPLSLSYDHRVIDGADAIKFLRWIVEALEQPMLMSLQT